LDLSPRALLKGVRVAPIPEDFLIRIDVDLPNPEDAQDVANALAQDFVEYHAAQNIDLDWRDRIEILILEEAEYGTVQWPKVKTLALAGAIFGLLLGAILALALQYLESGVIRSSEDVEQYVGIAVLGLIPTFAAGKISSWSAKNNE
jgi:capsular polysaccharide biosynthesis protein